MNEYKSYNGDPLRKQLNEHKSWLSHNFDLDIMMMIFALPIPIVEMKDDSLRCARRAACQIGPDFADDPTLFSVHHLHHVDLHCASK